MKPVALLTHKPDCDVILNNKPFSSYFAQQYFNY